MLSQTGRVCVPIDPSTVDEWDPHSTPTVASLADELDSNAISNQKDEDSTSNKRMKISDVDKTSLKSYMEYFENSFLAPLYADIKQNFRDEAEKQAAIAIGERLSNIYTCHISSCFVLTPRDRLAKRLFHIVFTTHHSLHFYAVHILLFLLN